MRALILPLLTLLVFVSCVRQPESEPISLWLARSEVKRLPNPVNLDFQVAPKWDYSSSVELMGILAVAERYQDKALQDYVMQWVDTMVTEQGAIRGYNPQKYNIDHLCPGKLLLKLYRQTGNQRFMTAASRLMEQFEGHPRTSEGGLWHKQVYPHQMWLDGLYMGAPFVAEYSQLNNRSLAEDMTRQYLIVASHTYDSETQLYRHAWDESKQMFWADPETGQSQHAWGRANGWYMMGMVDILEFIPVETDGRDSLLNIFRNLARAIQNYRDPATGMWYQVLDSPGREGNLLESSSSAMFIYSMLKGARLGYLPAEFKDIAEEAFSQFVARFVRRDKTKDGELLSLTDCCAVAGLGGKDMRSGTFDYYINEIFRDNDPKTIGPFLLACLELGM